jgi:hypothetical protein
MGFKFVSSTEPNNTASVFDKRFKVCSGNGFPVFLTIAPIRASSK